MTTGYAPSVVELPDATALAQYLSINAIISDALTAELDDACTDAADYELGRLSIVLMVADGADPPNTVPSTVARAILMRAAALHRRRNSVNGFDGFDDLGTVPIRASDPDIERLVDRYRAWTGWA